MRDEVEFSLVMPFIVCDDHGGPFDAQAYVCGFEAGRIDQMLQQSPKVFGASYSIEVHAVNLPQLDLIAMHHGWQLITDADDEGEEWRLVHIQHSLDHPEVELGEIERPDE